MGTTGIYTFAAPYLTWFLHTTEKAPHPVWSGKLSSVGPHQYCDRWLRGNPRWGTVFLLFSAPVQNRLFFSATFFGSFSAPVVCFFAHLCFAFPHVCFVFSAFCSFLFLFFPAILAPRAAPQRPAYQKMKMLGSKKMRERKRCFTQKKQDMFGVGKGA